jgi:hypothetical protein
MSASVADARSNSLGTQLIDLWVEEASPLIPAAA